MGSPAADIGDVVQEVFLAAAKSARQFDPERGSVWMWLTGIARNQVALRFRQRRSRLESARRWWAGLDGPARDWLAGSADAPDAVVQAKELGSLVRATLLELPEHYQTLLTSRYLDGTRIDEIARETGSTHDAVRARLMRARRAFRAAFRKLAGPESEVAGSSDDEQQ